MEHETRHGQLPVLVVGPVEVSRLLRELQAIDDTLLEHTLRKDGKSAHMLKTSQLMDQLVSMNKLSLLHSKDRERLTRFLETVKQRAPLLHISFSADPSPAFMERLMDWLRREIHPQVLVTVGVQPTIAAGCIVRGPNKYFDFSLRQDLAAKQDILLQGITGRQPSQPEKAAS